MAAAYIPSLLHVFQAESCRPSPFAPPPPPFSRQMISRDQVDAAAADKPTHEKKSSDGLCLSGAGLANDSICAPFQNHRRNHRIQSQNFLTAASESFHMVN